MRSEEREAIVGAPEGMVTAGGGARAPELLAPAGDMECARAAVENGADAIYFGLERFNARMRAQNFTLAALPGLMDYLHGRGVRGYVTFNTLVFTDELPEAERYLRGLIAAGVDAVIVQDVGLCRLIRELSPDFPIHASTQMTVTSAAGVRFAAELGCELVVLARECSIREIEAIRRGDGLGGGLPLEVFVHGALCVAYSGQCLTSEALGGRSANRGECAQACRMPYELMADGKAVPLGDRRYLLSPQDLSGLEVLPDLIRAGVSSLKIEGRLKSPEYVASITRVYREAIDRAMAGVGGAGIEGGAGGGTSGVGRGPADRRYELEMAFSRGLHTGWFEGVNNQRLVHARFGKKRGVYLGRVHEVGREEVVLRLENLLKAGDGVVFDAGRPEEGEEGGRVTLVAARGEFSRVRLHGHGVDWGRVRAGDRVWKTSDPDLDRELRGTYEGDQPRFARRLDFEVGGGVGRALVVVASDEFGHTVEVESAVRLVAAVRRPLTAEVLAAQLGRLGGTPFRLGELRAELEGAVMLPVSELNRMRREVVSKVEALWRRPRRWTLRGEGGSYGTVKEAGSGRVVGSGSVELVVMVRSMAQLEAAISSGVRVVYCELENPKGYREAVGCFRQAAVAGGEIFVAPPRIHKTGEDWILKLVRSSEADGYLVRNSDHLESFRGCRCIGDGSLNVANPLSAAHFVGRYGLERLTVSYDLNVGQVEALLKGAPAGWFEITLHQHIPMFHMEHCVFCAFLSEGTDYTNCGRPCDKHEVRLRDRVGAAHPLRADAGCRNTVYNALAQTGAEFFGAFRAAGADRFRLEFLDEDAATVGRTIGCYRALVEGRMDGAALWRELRVLNQLGVTRGQMGKASGVDRRFEI